MNELRTTLWVDGETAHVRRSQDVEPILEHAQALRSIGAVGSNEMRHAASFPKVIVETYLNTHGITLHEFHTNPEHVKRMLNDPALAGYRIWEGKV